MADHDKDIYDLLSLLERSGWERYRATAVALIAERDKLADDLKWQQDLYDISCATNSQLRERVAELEAAAQPRYIFGGGRVESIDLRERLVCAALTGMLANSNFSHSPSEMGEWAERYAYEAIAAMRKEGGRE